MEGKKPKMRLRKQFIIALPIFLIITIVSTIMVIVNNRSYAAQVEKVEETAPVIIEDLQPSKPQIEETTGESKPNLLNDNEYLKRLSNYFDNAQKDNTIVYYANKFKLKEDKVLELAKKLTEDYTKEEYLRTNVIGSSSVIAKVGSFNSFEAGVAFFVRDLYRNPTRYGTTSREIVESTAVEVNNNIVKGTIYMSNGLTFEQYYGKIADLFGIDKSIALAMVYHESGNMKSGLARNNNNIGGLKGGGGWLSFPTLEAGIIAHVLTIKSISEKNGFDITDPDGIYKFSGIYVRGNVNSPSEDWVNKVNWYKEKIDSKDVFTIK